MSTPDRPSATGFPGVLRCGHVDADYVTRGYEPVSVDGPDDLSGLTILTLSAVNRCARQFNASRGAVASIIRSIFSPPKKVLLVGDDEATERAVRAAESAGEYLGRIVSGRERYALPIGERETRPMSQLNQLSFPPIRHRAFLVDVQETIADGENAVPGVACMTDNGDVLMLTVSLPPSFAVTGHSPGTVPDLRDMKNEDLVVDVDYGWVSCAPTASGSAIRDHTSQLIDNAAILSAALTNMLRVQVVSAITAALMVYLYSDDPVRVVLRGDHNLSMIYALAAVIMCNHVIGCSNQRSL